MYQSAEKTNKSQSNSLIQRAFVGEGGATVMLCLNRPTYSNAYNTLMLDLLESELRSIIEMEKVRAIIITGKGNRAFCAGADKNDLKGRRIRDGLNLRSRQLFDLLATLPILTIAAINGAAVGGGLELILACDIRVSTITANFSLPELSFGLSPAAGGMRRLPDIVGRSRAKEIILLSRELDATTALEWGLVTYIGDDFEKKALEIAEQSTKQDPLALSLAKRLIDSEQNFEKQNLA